MNRNLNKPLTQELLSEELLSENKMSAKIYYIPGCTRREPGGQPNAYDELALSPIQTHSNNVKVVSGADNFSSLDLNDTDALVTFSTGLPIGVRTADCVPILLYAEDVNGIAAIHAGWKGTLGGIVDNALDIFEQRGADLSQMRVVFGPSISEAVYEVDEELAGKFSEGGLGDYVIWPQGDEKTPFCENRNSKPHIDLQGANIERLLRRGVKHENITLTGYCTLSSTDLDGTPLFPSYRRDKTSDRLLTTIELLKMK